MENTTTDCLNYTDPCDYVQGLEDFFYWMYLGPATLLVILFSFFEHRNRLFPKVFNGRPGLTYPINFVDEHSRRWAFAAVFTIFAHRLISLLEGNYIWKPDEFESPEWMANFGWVKVLVGFVNALFLGMVFFPLLGALVYRRQIIANVIGIVAVAPFFWSIYSVWDLCPLFRKNEDVCSSQERRILQVMYDVPRLLCFAVILVAYTLDLVLNVRAKVRKHKGLKPPPKEEPLPIQYLRYVLNRKPEEVPSSLIQKVKHKFIYKPVPGFKYSSRVICTMIVAVFALYKVSSELHVYVTPLMPLVKSLVEIVEGSNMVPENYSYVIPAAYAGVEALNVSFIVSNVVSFVFHVVFIGHMIVCYRQHMLKMYRGDRRWHFSHQASAPSQVVAGLRYSGYQIAYLFYGYFILLLILLLVCMVIAFGIILPFTIGYPSIIINQIRALWPGIILSFGLLFAQVLLAKYVLLQNKGAYMALDNRRFFHILSYFLFFANILLGIFACLKRILISLVFGVLFVSRLDRNLMMRGVEQFDSGFKSYLGFLAIDLHHNHPIMKAFIILLKEEVAGNKTSCTDVKVEYKRHSINGIAPYDSNTNTDNPKSEMKTKPERCVEENITNEKKPLPEHIVISSDKSDISEKGQKKVSTVKSKKMWRNKWRKCVTLINNPLLVVERLHQDVKDNQRNFSKKVADEIMDQMANAGTVMVGATALGVGNAVSDIPVFDGLGD